MIQVNINQISNRAKNYVKLFKKEITEKEAYMAQAGYYEGAMQQRYADMEEFYKWLKYYDVSKFPHWHIDEEGYENYIPDMKKCAEQFKEEYGLIVEEE